MIPEPKGTKVPGELIPGTPSGYVVESKYVKGTYIIVPTFKYIDLIPEGSKVEGVIIYVANEDEEYRLHNGAFIKLPRRIPIPATDNNIYAFQDGHWVRINSTIFATNDDIRHILSNFYTKKDIDKIIAEIEDELKTEIGIAEEETLSEAKDYTDTRFVELNRQIEVMYAASKQYTDDEIEKFKEEFTPFNFEVVDELPEKGEAGTIYFVPHEHGEDDIYDEYIYTDGKWEKIGNTDIDLSDYVTHDELTALATSIVAAFKTELDKIDERIKALEEKVDTSITSLEQADSDIKAELETLTDNTTEEIEGLTTSIDVIKTNVGNLNESMSGTTSQIAALLDSINGANSKIDKIKDEVESIKSDYITDGVLTSKLAETLTEAKNYTDEQIKTVANKTYSLKTNQQDSVITLVDNEGTESSVDVSPLAFTDPSLIATIEQVEQSIEDLNISQYATKDAVDADIQILNDRIDNISAEIEGDVITVNDDVLLQCGDSVVA